MRGCGRTYLPPHRGLRDGRMERHHTHTHTHTHIYTYIHTHPPPHTHTLVRCEFCIGNITRLLAAHQGRGLSGTSLPSPPHTSRLPAGWPVEFHWRLQPVHRSRGEILNTWWNTGEKGSSILVEERWGHHVTASDQSKLAHARHDALLPNEWTSRVGTQSAVPFQD